MSLCSTFHNDVPMRVVNMAIYTNEPPCNSLYGGTRSTKNTSVSTQLVNQNMEMYRNSGDLTAAHSVLVNLSTARSFSAHYLQVRQPSTNSSLQPTQLTSRNKDIYCGAETLVAFLCWSLSCQRYSYLEPAFITGQLERCST
jgi:hypothetical protein